jgi:hypothetical protein
MYYTEFVLGYRLENWEMGDLILWWGRDFSLFHNIQTGSESHPASCVMSTGAISLGVKQPGHEVDHSPPCSTEVRDVWSYIFTFLHILTAWRIIKHSTNTEFVVALMISIKTFHMFCSNGSLVIPINQKTNRGLVWHPCCFTFHENIAQKRKLYIFLAVFTAQNLNPYSNWW